MQVNITPFTYLTTSLSSYSNGPNYEIYFTGLGAIL